MNIRSRDVFRPILRERKYLMDYNEKYVPKPQMKLGTTEWQEGL